MPVDLTSALQDKENAKFLLDDAGNIAIRTASSPEAQAGKSSVNLARNVYSTINVTTSAYVELVASLSDVVSELYIFDSSGQTLILAVGAAGFEVDKIYIVPGGNGRIDLGIPAGSRVSIKAVSGLANTGEINVSFLK